MKPRLSFLGVVALLPILGFLFHLAFGFAAYVKVGHWPYQNHPDSQSIGPPLLGKLLLMTAVGFILLVPVAAVMTGAFYGRREIGSEPWHRAVMVIGCVLFFSQLLQLGSWFAD